MPEVENWAEAGFPDNFTFRSPYLPAVALCKAYNERLDAEGEVNDMAATPSRVDIPEYFTSYPGMRFTLAIEEIANVAQYKYIDPAKISTARNYSGCFWDGADLLQAALNGEDIENVTSYSRPEFSVKWAIWMYNAINLLRYVPTSKWQDWPTFTYEDRYDTFNFKEVSE